MSSDAIRIDGVAMLNEGTMVVSVAIGTHTAGGRMLRIHAEHRG